MTVNEFIDRYREAFGDAAPMPIAFGYSNNAVSEIKKVPKCMIGTISNVRHGESLTLAEENVICGGGGLYTAFREMPERVPMFVSEVEHYKKSKEMVIDYVNNLHIQITNKPYLNFVRIDKLKNWEDAEAILFFATPDILSGLCTWAFYDNNSSDAVTTQFASGCAAIVTFAINENRRNGNRCFLGMFDPSARPLVPENELTFTIPMSRFMEMLETMNDSGLFQKAFSIVKKRINKIKQ
ncbi:MAG: DUF169 domain-containing protein [Bacteroidaceae bacterium]|nr:DUF169 domain-containing protein [Bacteroidaceae bacterium]